MEQRSQELEDAVHMRARTIVRKSEANVHAQGGAQECEAAHLQLRNNGSCDVPLLTISVSNVSVSQPRQHPLVPVEWLSSASLLTRLSGERLVSLVWLAKPRSAISEPDDVLLSRSWLPAKVCSFFCKLRARTCHGIAHVA